MLLINNLLLNLFQEFHCWDLVSEENLEKGKADDKFSCCHRELNCKIFISLFVILIGFKEAPVN